MHTSRQASCPKINTPFDRSASVLKSVNFQRLTLIVVLLTPCITKAQLNQFFQREAQYQHFNGAVRVQKGEKMVLNFSYGEARPGQMINESTAFDIGSISKQFIAAAILHLAMDGQLDLQGPINPYLGSFASDRWKKVTIHHLLTHTSGIPSLYQTEQGLELFFPKTSPISKTEILGKFKDAKLLFSPGKKFSYNNSGYMLLAAIIEEVTQKSVADYLEENIFRRYGLVNTSVGINDQAATPYYGYRNDLLKEAPIYHQSYFLGAGGIFSTTEDLSKWLQTIQSPDFLNDDLRPLLFKRHLNEGYGYGWQVDQQGKLSHDGATAGATSYISLDPDTNTTIVILTNRGFESIHQFDKSIEKAKNWHTQITKFLNGESLEMLPNRQSGPLASGSFQVNENELRITPQDTSILLTLAGSMPSRILTNTPLEGQTDRENEMLAIADQLEKAKYWKLAKYCSGDMKIIMYSGLFGAVFKKIRKRIGNVKSSIAYHVYENKGLIRMTGKNIIQDFIVYFNSKGKVMGIFEHGTYDQDYEQPMLAYPLGNGRFYIDGFPYGEPSSFITIVDQEIFFEQGGRIITGSRQP